MWKQLTITLLSISCLGLSQELKIHLTEEGTQEDNIETRLLTVRLDKEFLQPSVMERLSKTSNIIFADFPEMPEFVNAKQYEDILNSLYDEKEEQHTSEEHLQDKTAYIGKQEEQENEKNILDQTEGEQNSKNKESVENDSAQNEKNKYAEDKLPELKKEEEKEIKEKIENKKDERWVNADEGKNINNDSLTDDNKEINREEQTNNKEKKLVKEKEEVREENERYEDHIKGGDRECKSKNKNIITSKIQTIKKSKTENKTTTIVFTTEKQKFSSLCTPTNITLVSKTRSILRCSSTGYLKQHNGTLPNFTNVTTVVVEESKTFKISSSFTFAFIVFIISTGLVIGF